MTAPTQNPAPGWYDDGSGRQRWWDGTAWGPFATAQASSPEAPTTVKPKNPAGTWAAITGAIALVLSIFGSAAGGAVLGIVFIVALVAFITGIVGTVIATRLTPHVSLGVSIFGIVVGVAAPVVTIVTLVRIASAT